MVYEKSVWAEHVSRRIRELRNGAGLNQGELARAAGLTQSHISRLENARHSATHLTLTKVAEALDVGIGVIDPCVDSPSPPC
jgi:transcriptional regulator with XRE-family HTH domain